MKPGYKGYTHEVEILFKLRKFEWLYNACVLFHACILLNTLFYSILNFHWSAFPSRQMGNRVVLTMNDRCGLYCGWRTRHRRFRASVERVLWTGWGSGAESRGKGAYLFMDKPVLYCAIKPSYLSTSKLQTVLWQNCPTQTKAAMNNHTIKCWELPQLLSNIMCCIVYPQ